MISTSVTSYGTGTAPPSLDFRLPPDLEAGSPPEARGLRRDAVRLMVSITEENWIWHTRFFHLARFLSPGDVLLLNTSATINAALRARRENGEVVELHLSTRLDGNLWSVELRTPSDVGTEPFFYAQTGERLEVPAGGKARLISPYPSGGPQADDKVRLWRAVLELPEEVFTYLEKNGFPIRYKYVRKEWPNHYYQTVYADEPGSAEMPSAGRPFTRQQLASLEARGIHLAPLLLHTGVASLEDHELPYPEYYRVPEATARAVNEARRSGNRVVAVGTTSARAIETVAEPGGVVHSGEGWTDLIITPNRGMYAVNALLTGLHEPRSSHLAMLSALANEEHLCRAYAEALRERYLWHEFGDTHLILTS